MTWMWWLAAPVLATVLASLVTWVGGRPTRTPSTRRSIRTHDRYLDALPGPARGHQQHPPRP